MIEANDIEQLVYLFGVGFDTTTAGGTTIFEIPTFGTKIIFNETTLTGTVYDDNWRVVTVNSGDLFEEKKMEIFWELMKAGYVRYLRIEIPRTFKSMIVSQGWDKKIIKKRLEIYKEDAKYNYLRELNKWALKESSAYVLAMDPGFFDFLLE